MFVYFFRKFILDFFSYELQVRWVFFIPSNSPTPSLGNSLYNVKAQRNC